MFQKRDCSNEFIPNVENQRYQKYDKSNKLKKLKLKQYGF